MTDIFDFNDTSDVTDEALEFVLEKVESGATVAYVREYVRSYSYVRIYIIAARLIQKHEPDLIVDPVTKRVREIEAEYLRGINCDSLAERSLAGYFDRSKEHILAKAAYLAGMKDAGK